MKVSEIKINDRVKYYLGFKNKISEGVIRGDNGQKFTLIDEYDKVFYLVAKDEIISVIKEEPIDHPPKPIIFEFFPTVFEVNNGNRHPGWSYNPEYRIKGIAHYKENGINNSAEMTFPFNIGINCDDDLIKSKFKITIEKI